MTLLFISLAAIIVVVVILVSARPIKAGIEARSEVNKNKKPEDLKSIEEEALEKLKDKDLTAEDLKKLYDEIQKKK